jgi:hypothetical protein
MKCKSNKKLNESSISKTENNHWEVLDEGGRIALKCILEK